VHFGEGVEELERGHLNALVRSVGKEVHFVWASFFLCGAPSELNIGVQYTIFACRFCHGDVEAPRERAEGACGNACCAVDMQTHLLVKMASAT